MGGSTSHGWENYSWPPNEVRTVVLIGKTGNGKSSTGNSIIGRRQFKSESSSAGVTYTCQLQNTALEDGKILNVIDTPGLFDFTAEPEHVAKEISKCIDMARDGIHALLVVLSVRSRFSREEEACIQSLMSISGGKFRDYMIVVFTGGDDLDRDGQTLDDYLGHDSTETLKEILRMCENRCVLFDNCTADESKKAVQLKQLLFLVNNVVENNDGKPFTTEPSVELKREANKLHDQMAAEGDSEKSSVTEKVEAKLKEAPDQLRQESADERATRMQAEAVRRELSYERVETRRLREELENARKELLRHRSESRSYCNIF